MASIRFSLDLAIPKAIYDGIPTARKMAYRDGIRELKALATKIGIENTTKAVWHKCYHDEIPIKPCEAEQDI